MVAGADAGAESGPELARVAGLVRDVPDYPSPGILFRDITPVLADAEAFTTITTELASLVGDADIVAGVEARGFLLGAAVAVVAGTGVIPVRKAGKLPRVAGSRTYELEYGTATLELPAETVDPGHARLPRRRRARHRGHRGGRRRPAGRGGRHGGRVRHAARAHRAERPGTDG